MRNIGWQPATFVSSRNTRQEKKSGARPEDFMDEEDLEVCRFNIHSCPNNGAVTNFCGINVGNCKRAQTCSNRRI